MSGAEKQSAAQTGTLYIIATPIGNLGDITYRAVDTLRNVDVIACEDTRVSGKLLQHYGIPTPTISYNDHNAPARRPELLARLERGEQIALISDAGTPLISDPGYKLVSTVREAGYNVLALPGASSVLTALCIAGLPTDQFTFAGFLPNKDKARRDAIAELAALTGTLVLLESPRRLKDSLPALAEGLGNRQAAIARELTKLHEECHTDSLIALAEHYREAPAPKGEVVLVIGPPAAKAFGAEEIDALLQSALQTHTVKDASALVAKQTGVARKTLYARAQELK